MRFAIRNLRASRVNLLMNDYAAGLPSPLAFIGLADAVTRDLNLEPWSARVLPILHQVYVSKGRTRPEMEPDSRKGGTFSTVETVEDFHGSVCVSLILDIPGCNSESALARALIGRRIAGGIISNEDVTVSQVAGDGDGLRGLPRGYAMVRPDHLTHRIIAYSSLDDIDTIASILFPATREPGGGWHVAVATGYRLLEDPDSVPRRIRTRSQDLPHVFVEPCVGIAELVSVRNKRLVEMAEAEFTDLMWRWDVRGDLVLGHPAYQAISN